MPTQIKTERIRRINLYPSTKTQLSYHQQEPDHVIQRMQCAFQHI